MNQEELQKLSYSISYLSNEELEIKLGVILPDVFICLDKQDTIRFAASIIQQIKERYQRDENLHLPLVLLSLLLKKNVSKIQERFIIIVINFALDRIRQDEIIHFVDNVIDCIHQNKITSIEVKENYILGALSRLDHPVENLSEFPQLVSHLVEFISPYLISEEKRYHFPVILQSFSFVSPDFVSVLFLYALSSPDAEIQSLGNAWYHTHFPKYTSERNIPLSQLDQYTRLLLSINRFCSMGCPAVAKTDAVPTSVLAKAHEILSHCCLPASISEKFKWMVLAYPLILKQNDLGYVYAYLQTLFTVSSLWNLEEWKSSFFSSLWNGVCYFYSEMKSDTSKRDNCHQIITLSLSILCLIIHRFPLNLPVSLSIVQSCVKMLREEDLRSDDVHRNKTKQSVALELFQFLNSMSSVFPSLSSDVQASILNYFESVFRKRSDFKLFRQSVVIWLLKVYQPQNPVFMSLFLFLLDTNTVMNAGTVSSDIQSDLEKFVESIDMSEIDLNLLLQYCFQDVVSVDSISNFPLVAAMGVNGQGNLIALISSIYLRSKLEAVTELTSKRLSALLLLLLKEGLQVKTMQILVDKESWISNSTAVIAVSFQECVYHYAVLLLQYQLKTVSDLSGGVLSRSPFSPIFSVIRGFIENSYTISNNDLLHYAFYFMTPNEYLQLMVQVQTLFNPLSILTKRFDKSYQSSQRVLLSKCNYIHLLNLQTTRSIKVVAYSVVQQILEEIDSSRQNDPDNSLIISTILHYIICCADMPTTLIDLASTLLDQIIQNKQLVCIEILPTLIKSLYYCSSSSEAAEQIYTEIDYVFDKINPLFMKQLESIDFYMEDWTNQTYYCTVYAELHYFYFKNIRTFINMIYSRFITSTNRKQNRIGFLLLKSLVFADIQEFVTPQNEYLPQHIPWKERLYLHSNQDTLMTDGNHCVLERYFGDIQQICLLFYEHEDIIVKNCCCQILTLLYDFVIHHQDIATYSPQVLIDAMTQSVALKKTDISPIVEDIRKVRAGQFGDLTVVLNLAIELHEPFLVYAFIQEELLYSTINKPELRSASLFVDSSHVFTENKMMQQSSRLKIEEEYVSSMRPKASIFFFYSFHPHDPVRVVCSQIIKAIRGHCSESRFILDHMNELLHLIESSMKNQDPVLVLCACRCLRRCFSIESTSDFQQMMSRVFPLLFERFNDPLSLSQQQQIYHEILETMKSCVNVVINRIKSAETRSQQQPFNWLVESILRTLIKYHNSSFSGITEFCRNSVFSVVENACVLPSSCCQSTLDVLLEYLYELSNNSKINRISHHSEQIGVTKTQLLQRKYVELSQNEIMHVLEHFCECIDESDWSSTLNSLLSNLRNSDDAITMILLRILHHFVQWNPIRRNNFQTVYHSLYKVCLQQPDDQEELFFISSTVSILLLFTKNQKDCWNELTEFFIKEFKTRSLGGQPLKPLLWLLLELLSKSEIMTISGDQLLRLYPWIYILLQTSRSSDQQELTLVEGILPFLSVTPHYYITHHLDSFIQFIKEVFTDHNDASAIVVKSFRCIQQFLKEGENLLILRELAQPVSDYLHLVHLVVFPGKSSIVSTVASFVKLELEGEEKAHVMEWMSWMLNELRANNSVYVSNCFSYVMEIVSDIGSHGVLTLESVVSMTREFFATDVNPSMNGDRYIYYLKGINKSVELCSSKDLTSQTQLINDFSELEKLIKESTIAPIVLDIKQRISL